MGRWERPGSNLKHTNNISVEPNDQAPERSYRVDFVISEVELDKLGLVCEAAYGKQFSRQEIEQFGMHMLGLAELLEDVDINMLSVKGHYRVRSLRLRSDVAKVPGNKNVGDSKNSG